MAAYDRAQYIEERRRMMQKYADYLDAIEQGDESSPYDFGKTA